MPNTFYTFNTRKQNTKLALKYENTTYYITIDEGTYTPEQMVTELTAKINAEIIAIFTSGNSYS